MSNEMIPSGHDARHPASRPVPHGFNLGETLDDDETGVRKLLQTTEGYIVGRIGNEVLRLNTDAHLITVSPTGGGKGVGYVIPNLLDHPGSAVVVDIRGETVASTADARLLMGQNVVVLDPYNVTRGRWGSDSFNPLANLDPTDMRFEADIDRIANALMFDLKGRTSKEPIWDNSTRQMFSGFLTYMLCYWPEEHQNLTSLANLYLLTGPERENIIADLKSRYAKDPNMMPAIRLLHSYLTESAEKTKISANARVQGQTSLMWATERTFTPLLSKSTFAIDKLQTEPTTIYLVVPEEYINNCAIWVRLVLEAIFSSLKEVNDLFGKSSRELPQENRVLFLMDEFPAFGQLDTVQRNTNVVRGRGANLWLFMQHIEQLDEIYGQHNARTIMNNSAAFMAFGSNEIHELEYLSRVVGEEMFDVQTVQMGISQTKGGSKSTGTSYTVTNSESTSEGESKSESFSEGRSRGGSTAKARGSQDSTGTQTSQNESTNSGYSGPSSFWGRAGLSLWPSWDRSNEGQSKGRAFSRNFSQGFNKSLTKTKNWGRSTNRTTGTTTSTTHTTGRSTAEGQSENLTDSWSATENFSVSAKPEQSKIATARSLQRIIGGQNQLLKLRGHYAFICPRMDFILQDRDTGLFRFPDLALLSGKLSLATLWQQIKSLSAIDKKLSSILSYPPEDEFFGRKFQGLDSFIGDVRQLRHSAQFLLHYQYTDTQEYVDFFVVLLSRIAKLTNQSFEIPPSSSSQCDTEEFNKILSLLLFNDTELGRISRMNSQILSNEGIDIVKWLLEVYDRPLRSLYYAVLKAMEGVESENESYIHLNLLAQHVDNSFKQLLLEATRTNIERRHRMGAS